MMKKAKICQSIPELGLYKGQKVEIETYSKEHWYVTIGDKQVVVPDYYLDILE